MFIMQVIVHWNHWENRLNQKVSSASGAIIELDNRDNIFTPDKGIKFHIDAVFSDNILGSDYDYWKMNYYMFAYTPISKKIVGGSPY